MGARQVISCIGAAMLLAVGTAQAETPCTALPHGVELCTANTGFDLVQEVPVETGYVFSLSSGEPMEVQGMVFVFDAPAGVTSQDEMFAKLNNSFSDPSKVQLTDQWVAPLGLMDRIIWETTGQTGPEVSARSLFWSDDFFVLAVTSEPGLELTLDHKRLHELLVFNLRRP